MTYGKSRVQYDAFLWNYYKYDRFNVYFYLGGVDIGIYTAKYATIVLNELENKFDHYLEEDDRIQFIVYNKLEHFRQNNIGLTDEADELGGVTRIAGAKVFLYFEGDHASLERQIKSGLSQIIINKIMYGSSWAQMIKNSALLDVPSWYMDGVVSYTTEQWNTTIENRVKDGVMSGRFYKFNHLEGDDKLYAGHALWNYIGEVYGKKVIPNVLYMARISRNIESGFLFVLGVSLKTLIRESCDYYKKRYESDESYRRDPVTDSLQLNFRKSKYYSNFKLSPDGNSAVYTTDKSGKVKVWLYDFEKNRAKKIYKYGYKLERISDHSYPLTGWHSKGTIVSTIHEKKGKIRLNYYNLEEKKRTHKPIFKLEKILDFDYSDDGKEMVFSAVNEGQSDIYIYKIGPNIQQKITDDVYDDLNPRFIANSSKIVFTSNRTTDSLKSDRVETGKLNKNKDVYEYDLVKQSITLRNVTNTPNVDENHPEEYSKTSYTYLNDESGVYNRYVAQIDSVISHIDTTIHFRYVSIAKPISNYRRNILQHAFVSQAGKFTQSYYKDGRTKLYFAPIKENIEEYAVEMKAEEKKREENNTELATIEESRDQMFYAPVQIREVTETAVDSSDIDIMNYRFENEHSDGSTLTSSQMPSSQKNFTTKSENSMSSFGEGFSLPLQRGYLTNFAASNMSMKGDFQFANQLYQRFNGGPYVNPGLGMLVKIPLIDLFENLEVEGGIRFAFSNKNTEYFLSLENRKKRLDKKYIFQRQTVTNIVGFLATKTHINQGKIELSYPFSEVSAFKTTFNLRNDREVTLATDRFRLETPDVHTSWIGGKLEYIFDNTIGYGLNLFSGSRLKIFAEHYRQFRNTTLDDKPFQWTTFSGTDLTVVGFDFRFYQKIHRSLIWANRLSGSTSSGNRKLVYYLGGVANRVAAQTTTQFDYTTYIAPDQNYYFQTIAPPLRGFLQNVRNGNNFIALNSEIRFPVFRYFMTTPIRSTFVQNFQIILFGDLGTAWTGTSPYSNENSFNTTIIEKYPLRIILKNEQNPLVGGFGAGLRTKLFGYFVKLDRAWGVEDGVIRKPMNYLSLGFDF